MNLTYYSIDPRSNSARVSVLFILLSALIRVIYFSAKTPTLPVFLIHVLLVLAAAVLFVTFLVTLGRSKPAIMLLPVAMGVAFFIIKALDFESTLHTVLCITLYSAVLVIFGLTLLGVIRQKLLLYPLFGLPLLYHIIEDVYEFFFLPDSPPAFEWLPEVSVLCIMTSLFSLSIALQKRPPTERTES